MGKLVNREALLWLGTAAVLAVAGPWPGWNPSPVWGVLLLLGVVALARPRRWGWAVAAVAALALALMRPLPHAARLDTGAMARLLEARCRSMLEAARSASGQPKVRQAFAAAGEVLEPGSLFDSLRGAVGGVAGRTVYLVDDRGRVVAWAGEQRQVPGGVQLLGERRWQIEWWIRTAALVLREPVMEEGRFLGGILVVDRTPVRAHTIWGMAQMGFDLRIAAAPRAGWKTLTISRFPGVSVAIRGIPSGPPAPGPLRYLPWWLLAALALWLSARGGGATAARNGRSGSVQGASNEGRTAPARWLAVAALSVAAAGYLSALATAQHAWVASPFLLETGLAGALLLRMAAPAVARAAAIVALLVYPAAVLAPQGLRPASWLPETALVPGWGVAGIVALACFVWSAAGRKWREGLEGRLLVGAAVALAALGAQLTGIPVWLTHAARSRMSSTPSALPVAIEEMMTAPFGRCHMEDLAPALAGRWQARRWAIPVAIRVEGDDGTVLSQWGDLSPAGDAVTELASWNLGELPRGRRVVARLLVATGPWHWLADWKPSEPVGWTRRQRVWFASLGRGGRVAASLHPSISGIATGAAGRIWHAGSGWAWVESGGRRLPGRVERHGDWLVAAVYNAPPLAVWLLQVLLAVLWGVAGTVLAAPPRLNRRIVPSFGGRLRRLVAGSVVLPLLLLTVVLHVRLRAEVIRVSHVIAVNMLDAARWTAQHLEGGSGAGDDLAAWLAAEVDAEVTLFDGARVAGVSRPDLLAEHRLPGLPDRRAFVNLLLGRSDPAVEASGNRVVAAGAVLIGDRPYLLELLMRDPGRSEGQPGVLDWLLTGALLAALGALVVTMRVERRLGSSLASVVELADRVQRGEVVGEVSLPEEVDLARVVESVRRMSLKVQERERRLRTQEELLRITLSTLTQAVIVMEEDGTVRFVNPAGEALLAEHGELAPQLGRRLDASGQGGTPSVETVQPFPGIDITWRVGTAHVPLPGGRMGRVLVVDDISEVVRADRLAQLTEMARIVAHEVKNPLTPIRLWVQELHENLDRPGDELKPLVREACAEISEQVERLRQTASSFSNLVALESWEPQVVDLARLVRELPVAGVLERRGITLERIVPKEADCRVVGDRDWLLRALSNIVQNSFDVLQGRGGEIVIEVGCDSEAVHLEVRDTGGGVEDSMVTDLFRPHFSTTGGGSGLGLALVRRVVERCHGTVRARNTAEGLAVHLELPRASGTMSP